VLRVDPTGLAIIADRVFAGAYDEPDTDHLAMELPSVQEAIVDLQARMAGAVETDFEDLVVHCTSSFEVVAYFLGLLELARWGIVRVSQEDRFAPIIVGYSETEAAERFDSLMRGEEAQ
jgi:chromatin segregation and condensation protein Rec8/ScpA/Scc1 (kleisin family)